MWVSKTANQKGKGAAGALEDQFLRWRHLYTLAFLHSAYREPFAVFKLTRFFCFFSLSEGGAMVRCFDRLSTSFAHHKFSCSDCAFIASRRFLTGRIEQGGWHRRRIGKAVLASMRFEADAKTVIPRSGTQKACSRQQTQSVVGASSELDEPFLRGGKRGLYSRMEGCKKCDNRRKMYRCRNYADTKERTEWSDLIETNLSERLRCGTKRSERRSRGVIAEVIFWRVGLSRPLL
jgi:hypothetical protein